MKAALMFANLTHCQSGSCGAAAIGLGVAPRNVPVQFPPPQVNKEK